MISYDFENGFPTGTFDIGDKVYHVRINTHRFSLPEECPYCNSTGSIEFKGKIFRCPECNGRRKVLSVDEMEVESETDQIQSKVTMIWKNDSRELYYTDKFLGLLICLQDNGDCRYFKTREEAQKICDAFNAKNNVYKQLEVLNKENLFNSKV